MRRVGFVVVLAVVGALMALPVSLPAGAGGSWLDPVADRYEAGDEVTLVGYSGSGTQGALSDGPFYGYLFWVNEDLSVPRRAIPLPVGEITMRTAPESSLLGGTRAAITFELPDYAPPGTYFLDYCNRPCDQKFGDLIGGYFSVGIDPKFPVVRPWPEGEPELANLADDALVWLAGRNGPRSMSEVREQLEASELARTYRDCVRAAGLDLGVGAQVLLNDRGEPWHVKTALDVPGDIHGPCFATIGGQQNSDPETSASSWSASLGGCRITTAIPPTCRGD